jgi:NADPH-dependent 2,4-dienoyl-CoA reductase/sulfur reductase-like enzyme
MNLIRVMPAQGWLERIVRPGAIWAMRSTDNEKRSYDALVVGAGVIGLACALEACG